MLLIQNATDDWTKSLFFYPHYIGNQQSCLQESSVRNARIYNKLMLYLFITSAEVRQNPIVQKR